MEDKYNLKRFIDAQELDYDMALLEIKSGRKRTHWIWYIFPQLKELGYSSTAKYYGIQNIDEAKAYINNITLKKHLLEITEELYKLDGNISNIMGYPDDLKLKSSMTLFSIADSSNDIYKKILDKFYNGEVDQVTKNLLKNKNS